MYPVFAEECEDGEIRNCPALGECGKGFQTCMGGEWSSCDVFPEEEVCGDEKDNDCDGVVDNDCVCVTSETRECGTDVGICQKGVEICINNTWTNCTGGITPLFENLANGTCSNQVDDDCDGKVDSEEEDCVIVNLCISRQRDFDETGIDCGGPTCPPCPVGQGCNVTFDCQQGLTCSGFVCSAIAVESCFDGVQNQNETGIDCGGVCAPCVVAPPPNITDSDNDGIIDEDDIYPLCNDATCERFSGIGKEQCPEKCKTPMLLYIIPIIFILLVLILFMIYFFSKKRKKKEKKPPKLHSYFVSDSAKKPYSDVISEELKKIK